MENRRSNSPALVGASTDLTPINSHKPASPRKTFKSRSESPPRIKFQHSASRFSDSGYPRSRSLRHNWLSINSGNSIRSTKSWSKAMPACAVNVDWLTQMLYFEARPSSFVFTYQVTPFVLRGLLLQPHF